MNRSFAFAMTIAFVAGCGPAADVPPTADVALPDLETVRAESLATALPVSGSVVARARAELATRTMAYVSDVPVDVGMGVASGTVLVRLGLDDAAAQRTAAQAAVRAAEATADETARHAERMDTLASADAVPTVQRDQARLGQLQAAAQRDMARAQLAQVEAQARYNELRAPFAGTVVARYVDPGDLAAPGTTLLVLEGSGPRDAMLAVPADLGTHLATGDTIRIVGPGGRTAISVIRAVSRGADPVTRTIEVKASLPADWPTGIAVTGLVPGPVEIAIAVPAAAVVHRGQLTGLRVLTGDRVVLRWVRLGRILADGRITVLSGLEPGERIVR